MAALLGTLPLMLRRGIGSELRQPLGYAMVGGLLLSQALTLFTTPVIDLYLDRVNSWFGRRRCGTISVEAAARTSGAPIARAQGQSRRNHQHCAQTAPVYRSTPAMRGSGSETGECAFVHSFCRDFCWEQFDGYSLA
jgi:hypothetical protein